MKHEAVGKIRAQVAAWRHGNPGRGLKIIAVAGAQGKTTTALYLGEILQEAGHTVMTMTSAGCRYNGTPLPDRYDQTADALHRCLAGARKQSAQYVVMEVSDALAAAQVLPTLAITMSIITNDSPSARVLLDQAVDYTVVPSGFDMAGLAVAPHQAISFGEDAAADAQIVEVKEYRKGTEIDMIIDHQTKLTVSTYLIGKANAFNVAAAVSAAYVLTAPTSVFEEGVARLETVAGNYEYLPVPEISYDVAVDRAYTPTSVEMVLTTANALKKRRLLVIADASIPSDLYETVKRLGDRVMVVGTGPEFPGVEQLTDLQSALDLMRRGAKKDDIVLLIGREVGALQPDGRSYAHRLVEASHE